MALFFIEVLTEQRVRLACQAAHRVVAIAHDQRGQLSGVGNWQVALSLFHNFKDFQSLEL
jgi:hypothetical protein